jgi:hypothetical protein
MAAALYPFLNFFPAVQLARNLELGEWIVGVPDQTVAWRPEPFRELATKLLEASEPKEFKKPALVWHRERGFDGTHPSDDVAKAIQAAVRFALLDDNDQVRRDLHAARYLATSENGVFYRQPIDESSRSVAHETGGAIKRTLIGGWKIGERPVSLPDATQAIDRPVPVSRSLATAVYTAVVSQNQADQTLATAVEWHAIALANPHAVRWQQRIVALKTGFEALFGESKSAHCAAALRKLFEHTAGPHSNLFPWGGCLWSPAERVDLPRQYKKKPGKRSELEDWFMAFADVRNAIIHEGRILTDTYQAPAERPLSRYAGEFFWKAERILREAIKARLGAEVLLCSLLDKQKRREAFAPEILAWFKERLADDQRSSPQREVPATADPAEPARALPDLLTALGCPAANHVQVRREWRERRADDNEVLECWLALAGGREIDVSVAEKEYLKKAGAEDWLSEDFDPCD